MTDRRAERGILTVQLLERRGEARERVAGVGDPGDEIADRCHEADGDVGVGHGAASPCGGVQSSALRAGRWETPPAFRRASVDARAFVGCPASDTSAPPPTASARAGGRAIRLATPDSG